MGAVYSSRELLPSYTTLHLKKIVFFILTPERTSNPLTPYLNSKA
jgi:hypothetical protein